MPIDLSRLAIHNAVVRDRIARGILQARRGPKAVDTVRRVRRVRAAVVARSLLGTPLFASA